MIVELTEKSSSGYTLIDRLTDVVTAIALIKLIKSIGVSETSCRVIYGSAATCDAGIVGETGYELIVPSVSSISVDRNEFIVSGTSYNSVPIPTGIIGYR